VIFENYSKFNNKEYDMLSENKPFTVNYYSDFHHYRNSSPQHPQHVFGGQI